MRKEGFRVVDIEASPNGFGMYQRGAETQRGMGEVIEDYEEQEDWISQEDFEKEGIEDITGRIYGGDPDILYAVKSDDYTQYFGYDIVG